MDDDIKTRIAINKDEINLLRLQIKELDDNITKIEVNAGKIDIFRKVFWLVITTLVTAVGSLAYLIGQFLIETYL